MFYEWLYPLHTVHGLSFLRDFEGALVMTSHDREFTNRIVSSLPYDFIFPPIFYIYKLCMSTRYKEGESWEFDIFRLHKYR